MDQALEFNFWAAVVAGIAGGAVMSLLMTMARKKGMTSMDIAVIEGAFFTDDRDKAKKIGMFMHLVVMSGIVFGSIYAALYAGFDISDDNAWWWGLIFGAVHGVVAGVGMAMMPMMHPKMSREPVTAGAGGRGGGEHLELTPPGPFGKNMGKATPVGLVMNHMVYGLVVGLVYGAIV
jgi:hypothetical protein